jgi:IPT/TIG domain-containing protein
MPYGSQLRRGDALRAGVRLIRLAEGDQVAAACLLRSDLAAGPGQRSDGGGFLRLGGLVFMKGGRTLLPILGLSLAGALLLAQSSTNPRPLINEPLMPEAVAPGSGNFTLEVNGTGFVSGATVNWNGTPLTTMFVSGSQLTAVVPVENVTAPGTASITVANPGPGGRLSGEMFFEVTP